MRQSWILLLGACAALLLSCCCVGIAGRTIVKRDEGSSIDPTLQEIESDDTQRDKRSQDLGFGVKNALIGFVFGKINSFIDQKTRWLDQLDRVNAQKNAQHGIHAPSDPVTSLSGAISGAIGSKLQAAGPLLGVAVQTITSGSGGLSGGSGGFNIGSLLGGLSGGGGGAGAGASVGIGGGLEAEGHAEVGFGG